jgi:phage gpG-like protein
MSVYGLQLEVSVGNDTGEGALQRLAVAVERGGEAIADFGKYVFPKLGPAMEEAEAAQFEAEGAGPVAGSWAALTPTYQAWKEGVAPGMPILELSGALRSALTSSSASGARREATASDFIFGTQGLPYASFHQTGTAKMKARPPFDFGAAFEEAMKRVTLEGLREAIKESSRGQLELEGA